MTDKSIPLYEIPEIHERRWWILGVMAASLTVVVMSVSGLNVALPTLQESLDASNSALQWIIDSYALVFAGLLLTAGALGDRFGRRNALLFGLAVFAVGATVGGLGSTPAQVIAGRATMGAGAAFVMPATLSLVVTVFPPEERRRAIAIWAGFAGAGAAIGPIVSGALLEWFWWGAALLVNIPIVIVLAGSIAVLAPRSRDTHNTPLDLPGTALSLVGITALVFGIIEGPNLGWSSPEVLDHEVEPQRAGHIRHDELGGAHAHAAIGWHVAGPLPTVVAAGPAQRGGALHALQQGAQVADHVHVERERLPG